VFGSDSNRSLQSAALAGTLYMVASALSYGAMNISVKLSAPYLTVWQTVMGRFVLGVVLLPLIVWQLRLDFLGQSRWLLAGRGLAATGGFLLIVQAFKTIPLSVGMVIFYLWPVFMCLLSSWVAGEPTTKKEWPFIGGALAGTALIFWPHDSAAGLTIGHFMALGAAFLIGLANILIRRLGRTNNPFTIYFYFCLTGGLFCLGPLLSQKAPVLPAHPAAWFGLAAVAVSSMVGQVLMNQGMRHLKASKAGVLMMIEVIIASAFGFIYLSEPLGWRFLGGAALILGCGVALTVLPSRSQTLPQEPD